MDQIQDTLNMKKDKLDDSVGHLFNIALNDVELLQCLKDDPSYILMLNPEELNTLSEKLDARKISSTYPEYQKKFIQYIQKAAKELIDIQCRLRPTLDLKDDKKINKFIKYVENNSKTMRTSSAVPLIMPRFVKTLDEIISNPTLIRDLDTENVKTWAEAIDEFLKEIGLYFKYKIRFLNEVRDICKHILEIQKKRDSEGICIKELVAKLIKQCENYR